MESTPYQQLGSTEDRTTRSGFESGTNAAANHRHFVSWEHQEHTRQELRQSGGNHVALYNMSSKSNRRHYCSSGERKIKD
eukprot:812527-Ditylum_brightwellii.AAC.1